MKTISRLLLVSFLFLVMIFSQEALAGSGCGPTGCPAPSSVQRAPAAASASRAFTATGGSRVADVNLSPEAREVINAEGKEPPLPKGFLSAADRAKLIAKQPPLYGWPENAIARPVPRTQPHSSIATRVAGNSHGRVPVKPVTTVKVATAAKARSQN
jgi:hypothetical protein